MGAAADRQAQRGRGPGQLTVHSCSPAVCPPSSWPAQPRCRGPSPRAPSSQESQEHRCRGGSPGCWPVSPDQALGRGAGSSVMASSASAFPRHLQRESLVSSSPSPSPPPQDPDAPAAGPTPPAGLRPCPAQSGGRRVGVLAPTAEDSGPERSLSTLLRPCTDPAQGGHGGTVSRASSGHCHDPHSSARPLVIAPSTQDQGPVPGSWFSQGKQTSV